PFFFFFQAEDGIRDYKVTGVQTCALPILRAIVPNAAAPPAASSPTPFRWTGKLPFSSRSSSTNRHSRAGPQKTVARSRVLKNTRSEERRVGKEGRCLRSADPGSAISDTHT